MLNRIAATALAIAMACLAFAGFDYMFENQTLAAFVGACAGGFVLGRGFRTEAPTS